jgi:hypothetical protein
MKTIQLEWKEFKVNLEKVNEMAKIIDESCCGLSANSKLEVHFLEDISEEKEQELKDYWDSIVEESEEVKTYKSFEEIKEEATKKKESAKAKLAKLGLDAEEIAALLG